MATSDIGKAAFLNVRNKDTGEIEKKTLIPPAPSDGDLGGISEEELAQITTNKEKISALGEDIGNKAPAIIKKASGKTIIIDDSSNLPIKMLSGTGKIIITGKNILNTKKRNEYIPFEAKAGTLFTLITNGELSEGGNVKFIDENDETIWFSIDKGKTRISTKIAKNVKGYINLLVLKDGLKYCFSVGENDEYEEYMEQLITAPVDSEQLKAIHTNYPTTVLTSENEISVEYVVDTEEYIGKRVPEEKLEQIDKLNEDLGNVEDSVLGTLKETKIDALTLISSTKTENGYITPGRINNGIYAADKNNMLYCFFLNNGGKFKAENLSSDSYGNPTRCWCAFSGVNGTTDELLAEYSDQVQTSGRTGVSTGGYITFPHDVKMVVFAHANSDKSTISIKKLEDKRDGGIKASVDNALNDIEQLKVDVKSNTSVFGGRLLNENTYKTGIAEASVASTTSSITDGVIVSALKNDVANAEISEIFRYSVPMKIAGDTFPKYKAVTSGLPINLGYRIEFYFSGKEFEVMIHGTSALTVCIDEYSITSDCIQMPRDGNVYYQKVTFPSEIEHKHISIYIDGVFRGIKTNGAVEKYNANRLKIIADGDSITESTSIIGGGESVINSWISKLSKVFDYDLLDVAFGGTGYLNNGTGRVNMVDRFEDNVAKYNPDIIISMGGLNDSYSDLSALETAINEYWNKVSKLGCKAICVTPFNPQPTIMQISEAFLPILQKTCAKYGIPLIDTARGITYDSTGSIITDNTNGYIKGIINSNNHDAFIGSDNTHLTLKGHEYFAKRMESEMYKLTRIDKYFN